MISRTWFARIESAQRTRKKPERKEKTVDKYKIWVPDESMGILKHVENLGGCHVKLSQNIYEIRGISAAKLADFRGIFCISPSRTGMEREYLKAIQRRYGNARV